MRKRLGPPPLGRIGKARFQEVLAKVAGGVPEVTVHLAEGSPLHAWIDYTKTVVADPLILGSHGHGAVAALLLGSVAEGMVRKAVVPSLVGPAPRA